MNDQIEIRDGKPILKGCSVLPPLNPQPTSSPPGKVPKDNPPAKPKAKQQTADRFAVLNGFVDCSIASLTRAELATWLVLYRDTRKGTACTSADDIARRTGTSKRAILTAIDRLRKKGLLMRVFRGSINRGPSVYRVVPTMHPPDSR